MEKVRRLMDNVLNHADFTGNQKLHEEVGHTWEMLQDEVDEVAMRIYVATFEFDREMPSTAPSRPYPDLHKFRVLLPEEADNLTS
jgi:hypothetical protein